MTVGKGISTSSEEPQGIGPLTSQFLLEALDPPARLIATDGDATPIFKAAMEQSPEQAMGDIGTAFLANLQRQGATEETLVSMLGQLLEAGNIKEGQRSQALGALRVPNPSCNSGVKGKSMQALTLFNFSQRRKLEPLTVLSLLKGSRYKTRHFC